MEGVSKEQVKDFIKNMTLMDAASLVKELEEELGVSAAAPVAVAAAAGAAAGAGGKTEVNVILAEGGGRRRRGRRRWPRKRPSLTSFLPKPVRRRFKSSKSCASLPAWV